jgi:hypothetical protein
VEDVQLFSPGRIVHLCKVSEDRMLNAFKRQSSDTERYKPVWAKTGDFTEINISKTMLADHSPTKVGPELERVAASFGLKPPYFIDKED